MRVFRRGVRAACAKAFRGEAAAIPAAMAPSVPANCRRLIIRVPPLVYHNCAVMKTKLLLVALAVSIAPVRLPSASEQHLLYVASPGTRNYVEYGGVGILVFDIDKGYKFVRRIPTWDVARGKTPENVKGIAASAKTGRVYVTSLNRMIAIDAVTGRRIWDKTYEGGCDRM